MTQKKFITLAVLGILFPIVAAVAILWLLLAPPITKESSEQQGTQTVTLSAETALDGLRNPWDVGFLPDSTLIFNERSGEISKLVDGKKVVIQKIDDVASRGEGGLTGMAIDSDFANNQYIFTCYNSESGDVRVVRWKLNNEATELTDKIVLIEGIPSNQSGRHSGCRVKSAKDGALWIGTGDAAESSTPQDLQSLGGKILRVTRNGEPIAGNIEDGDTRIFNYGHRNIQGMTHFDEPVEGVYGFSIEHGSGENDEVNLIIPGNFGWDPLPPYNESVPMTDTAKFPNAVAAIWSSGSSTIAPSGGDIIRGESWGKYQNALAMAVLKNQHVRVLQFNAADYAITNEESFFNRDFGRIRSVTMGPDALYLTTDNGTNDKIIRVVPQS